MTSTQPFAGGFDLDRDGSAVHAPRVEEAGRDLADLTALGHSPLLSGLPSGVAGTLLKRIARGVASAGTVLAREGDDDDALSFILSGRAHVLRSSASIRELGGGDCFGQGSLAGTSVHPATVVAITDVRLARLGRG